MDQLGERTGRHYRLVDYSGDPEAERVLVLMGSGGETARETAAFLQSRGERVGVAQVRLYRPFPAQELARALPATVRRVAVLDRTKEPGSIGEPLFLDVLAALSEAHADGEREPMQHVIGGRYGLSSKEFTPAMAAAVLEELAGERPRRRFTHRDRRRRLGHEPAVRPRARHRAAGDRARGVLRPRLGRDGRREQEHDQDPRLRGGPARAGLLRLRLQEVGLADRLAPALRAAADQRAVPRLAGRFVGCHQFGMLERAEVLDRAAPEARSCSTAATRRTGSGTRCRARSRNRSSPSGSSSTSSTRAGSPAMRGSRAHEHGAADLLLRHLGCHGARPGDRADQGGDREDLTVGGAPRSSSETWLRSTTRSAGCTRSSCPSR